VKLAMNVEHLGPLAGAGRALGRLESAGLDLLYVSEHHGADAFTRAGYLACCTQRAQIVTDVVNVFSRSAPVIAMSAATCDELSGGRFVLGLGTSSPSIVEGFHGIPYRRAISRTLDYVEVCRKVWRREALVHAGRAISIPSPAASEPRKPLKFVDRPVRERIPIWWASIADRAVEATAELAEGWLPAWFIPERCEELYGPQLRAGLARRSSELDALEVSARIHVAIGKGLDTAELLAPARGHMALLIGGLGSGPGNFYHRLGERYGFVEEVFRMQELYRAGNREGAAAAVPGAWIEGISAIGSRDHVAERMAAFAAAGVTVLEMVPYGDPVAIAAELRDILDRT
jgi:F420-dependent oxidoreductase-like protein